MIKSETKIELKTYWETCSITFNNEDVSLEQMFKAFKSILIMQTWSEEQINEYIIELGDELKEIKKL